jgi:hypothetical protein
MRICFFLSYYIFMFFLLICLYLTLTAFTARGLVDSIRPCQLIVSGVTSDTAHQATTHHHTHHHSIHHTPHTPHHFIRHAPNIPYQLIVRSYSIFLVSFVPYSLIFVYFNFFFICLKFYVIKFFLKFFLHLFIFLFITKNFRHTISLTRLILL